MGESIGDRLHRERLERGMSQVVLAALIGVGDPYISKIENNKEIPTDGILMLIAAEFGLDDEELILQAGRIPQAYVAALTADPVRGLAHLRRFDDG